MKKIPEKRSPEDILPELFEAFNQGGCKIVTIPNFRLEPRRFYQFWKPITTQVKNKSFIFKETYFVTQSDYERFQKELKYQQLLGPKVYDPQPLYNLDPRAHIPPYPYIRHRGDSKT